MFKRLGPRAWLVSRAQLRHVLARPDSLQVLLITPLLTAVFLTLAHAGPARNLTPYAVLAPALMGMWTSLLSAAGSAVTEERNNGTLELVVASPVQLFGFVFGRLSWSLAIGLVALAEAWLVAALAFGEVVTVRSPIVTAAAAVLTFGGMLSTAGALASVFVLVPNARILQNTLNYPFFLLGGVLVPIDRLPDVLGAPSRLIFLSYGSDLIRAGVGGTRTGLPSWIMLILLSLVTLVLGSVAFRRVVERARIDGTLVRNG